MISDTRGLWYADMIRPSAARLPGAKSATGVLGLVWTRWRLASTDAGRNEALGLHELECRRLQGALSGFVELLGHGSVPLTCACGRGPTCTPQDLGTLRGGTSDS